MMAACGAWVSDAVASMAQRCVLNKCVNFLNGWAFFVVLRRVGIAFAVYHQKLEGWYINLNHLLGGGLVKMFQLLFEVHLLHGRSYNSQQRLLQGRAALRASRLKRRYAPS